MKRLAPLLLLIAAAPASAEITHSIQSSVQMTVDGAASAAQRIGSSLAVSGNNVTLSTSPTLGSLTAGSAVGYTPGAYSVTTAPSLQLVTPLATASRSPRAMPRQRLPA